MERKEIILLLLRVVKMLWFCQEEDVCLNYALMDGEDESLSGQRLFKDPRWRIAERSENLKKKMIKQPLHPHMLFGRVSRKILLAPPKTTVAYSVARHDWIFKRDRILWSVKTKQKWLFGIKPSRFEEYPMTTVKYTVGSYMLWCGPIYLLEVLDILFRYMVSWILSSTNR